VPDLVEHGLLQVEQLLEVVEFLGLHVEVVDLVAQFVDLVLGGLGDLVGDLLGPVEGRVALLALLELDEFLLEDARALHDLVALGLLDDHDFVFYFVDVVVEADPLDVGGLDVFELVVVDVVVELLEDLDGLLHGALVADHDFVDLVHVADALQHLLEQVLVALVRFVLDAVRDLQVERVYVLEQVVGVVEQEVALLRSLLLDDGVQVAVERLTVDLQEVQVVVVLEQVLARFLVLEQVELLLELTGLRGFLARTHSLEDLLDGLLAGVFLVDLVDVVFLFAFLFDFLLFFFLLFTFAFLNGCVGMSIFVV